MLLGTRTRNIAERVLIINNLFYSETRNLYRRGALLSLDPRDSYIHDSLMGG